MPTINQLVRKGRKAQKSKSAAPALGYTQNTLRDQVVYNKKGAPQKRGGLHKGVHSYAEKAQLSSPQGG